MIVYTTLMDIGLRKHKRPPESIGLPPSKHQRHQDQDHQSLTGMIRFTPTNMSEHHIMI